MDVNKKIAEMIVVSGQLASVLERENDALANYDRKNFDSLLEEKTRLGRIYESQMEGLAKGRDEDFAEADPDLGEQLRALGNEIRDLIERNARLLKIAIEANRRVVDLIADAVKSSGAGPGIYEGRGRIAAAGGHSHPISLPLSLDHSL